MKKICIILGTRPEIIKMASIIRECQKRKISFFIIHTNQHYAENLDKIFFRELHLPEPKYNLNIGSASHARQSGKMMVGIEKILCKEKPSIILVQGDTNTVMAGSLVAAKLHIKVGHIEAGLRSSDRTMPEEINRILSDHCSDLLFAPTAHARQNLLKEGIDRNKIFVVGNTIVDAIVSHKALARHSSVLKRLKLEKKKYFLATVHRQENVDQKEKLSSIIRGFELVYKKYRMPVFFPMHPRTKKMMEHFKLKRRSGVLFVDPLGYLDFLHSMENAVLIISDSGGVQEEACVLHIPCLTLRENTERPETLIGGGNRIVGTASNAILSGVEKMLRKKIRWSNPFGSGESASKVIDVIRRDIV